MKPDVLNNVGKREDDSAREVATNNNCCSHDCDLSIKFIQYPSLYNHIPERIGCILDLWDFTNEINWDEVSSCLYINIKEKYKQSYSLPLFEIKIFAKKISRFLLINDIQNYYMTIEICKGKYSENKDCKIVYRDFVTPNNTIDVEALIDFVYMLPILLRNNA